MSRTDDIDPHILCGQLSGLLGVELDVEDSTIVDGTALSVTVSSRDEFGGPLRLRYAGIVGSVSIDDAPYVSAVLFVYSAGVRLSVGGDEASYLAFVYERSDPGVGHWRLQGWQSDEYGEYAGFAELPGGRPRDLAP
jgi:hypothetical protein